MLLVIVVLIFFLYDFRAGLIVAASIPLALLFAFICLDLQNASANLLSIGAIDFGILVDGAVVMVENIFRQIVARKGTRDQRQGNHSRCRGRGGSAAVLFGGGHRRRASCRSTCCPGPSGTLFKPMADTMVFALIGALIVTLTLLPVLCAWFMRKRRARAPQRRLRIHQIRLYARPRPLSASRPWGSPRRPRPCCCSSSLLLIPRIGAEFMPQLDEGALWVRATMPYTISFDESAKIAPKVRDILRSFPGGHDGRLGTRPSRRRHRSDRLFQRGILCRPQALLTVGRPLSQQGRIDRGHQRQACSRFPGSPSTTRSLRKTRWMRRRPA